MMEEINNHIDPDNDISYGISNRGNEVMIVNEREIFHKKIVVKEHLIIILRYHGFSVS